MCVSVVSAGSANAPSDRQPVGPAHDSASCSESGPYYSCYCPSCQLPEHLYSVFTCTAPRIQASDFGTYLLAVVGLWPCHIALRPIPVADRQSQIRNCPRPVASTRLRPGHSRIVCCAVCTHSERFTAQSASEADLVGVVAHVAGAGYVRGRANRHLDRADRVAIHRLNAARTAYFESPLRP